MNYEQSGCKSNVSSPSPCSCKFAMPVPLYVHPISNITVAVIFPFLPDSTICLPLPKEVLGIVKAEPFLILILSSVPVSPNFIEVTIQPFPFPFTIFCFRYFIAQSLDSFKQELLKSRNSTSSACSPPSTPCECKTFNLGGLVSLAEGQIETTFPNVPEDSVLLIKSSNVDKATIEGGQLTVTLNESLGLFGFAFVLLCSASTETCSVYLMYNFPLVEFPSALIQ